MTVDNESRADEAVDTESRIETDVGEVMMNDVVGAENGAGVRDVKRKNNQYHPVFCDVMTQILEHDSIEYTYEREYNLNSMPNRIDFLVIKKNSNEESSYGIGKLFRGYNIFEYKSPGKSLGDKEYHIALAYAHLYTGYGKDIDYEDMTISFVRDGKPVKLMKYFMSKGFDIREIETGIYHVIKDGHIDIQIVVTSQIRDEYIWLKALTHRLTREDAEKLSVEAAKENNPQGRVRIKSIMDLVSRINRDAEWMKEVKNMGAFRDLFKDEFEEKDRMIAELSEQVKNRDEELRSRDEELKNRNKEIEDINNEKDNEIAELSEQVKNRDEELRSRDEELRNRDKLIEDLKKQLSKIAVL